MATVYLRIGIIYARFVGGGGRRTTRHTDVMSNHEALCSAAWIGGLYTHYDNELRLAIEELPDPPAGYSNSNGG